MISNIFPVERFDDIKKEPTAYRLLEQIPLTKSNVTLPVEFNKPIGDEKSMVLLDTETTGLSHETDEIIELGLVKILYSPSKNQITSVTDIISIYEEPTIDIPEFITKLTGIDSEKVKGEKFDDEFVKEFLIDRPLIVAHNSKFDRPFFEKRFPELTNLNWACSANGIDWQSFGFQSAKLEFLLLNHGWFYEGHRASIDCLAMLWLFHVFDKSFVSLLENARAKTIIVRALFAPFDVKDSLKDNGYRWNSGDVNTAKHWWKEVKEIDLEKEKEFLDNLYNKGSEKAKYDIMTAKNRFK